MSDTKTKKPRPLSPHLQIYKPQITSISSILHRLSGIALAIGLLYLVCGLMSLAGGRESYDTFMAFSASTAGQILLLGWSAAFFYHMCTGIRHFFLDAGYLYGKKIASFTGYAVIGVAVLLTLILWGGVYGGVL